MLAKAFAAVMLVAGEPYIQNKSDRPFAANRLRVSDGVGVSGRAPLGLPQ
jgi:hypothetical protein